MHFSFATRVSHRFYFNVASSQQINICSRTKKCNTYHKEREIEIAGEKEKKKEQKKNKLDNETIYKFIVCDWLHQ